MNRKYLNIPKNILSDLKTKMDMKEDVMEETDELYTRFKWHAVNNNWISELNRNVNPNDDRRAAILKRYIGTEENVVVSPYSRFDSKIAVTFLSYIDPITPTNSGIFNRYTLGESYYNTPKTITFEDGVEVNSTSSAIAMFDDCKGLEEIHGLENIDLGYCNMYAYMFFNCNNLKYADISTLKRSYNSMYMFAACGLPEIQLPTTFNTSECKNFSSMFHNTVVERLDLTMLDIRNARKMSNMFYNTKNLTEILVSRDKWVIPDGCDTTDMFTGCGTDHVTYVD